MGIVHLWQLRGDLLRYARSLGVYAAEAEDLTQTAFVRACEHADIIEGMSLENTRAYLFRTLRNACIDLIRKRTPEQLCADPQEGDSRYDDMSGLYVESMLGCLPPPLRECAYLRYVQGENSSQIALKLGIPAATVRTRLRAAILILRNEQKKENGK